MHQACKRKNSIEKTAIFVGGGTSTDTEYATWEVKQCHPCDKYYLEHYVAAEVSHIETAEVLARALTNQIEWLEKEEDTESFPTTQPSAHP